MKKKVIILGAGVGGLSAGYVLAKQGYEVVIIEKAPIAGGLAITKSHDGFRYDLGPHNIHTRHDHILKFLKRTFSSLFSYAPTFKVHKNGVFVPYPLRGLKVITSLPAWKVPVSIASFLAARIKMFAGEPGDDASFGAWIRNRFGNVLYREYFYNYPKKVWGIDPDEIDRHVGEKRIPLLSLAEIIRSMVLGRKPRLDHPEVTDANFYLREGIGELPDFFAKEFRKHGGTIHFNAEPLSVLHDGQSVTGVIVNTNEMRCDALLSTIPLADFIRLFKAAPDDLTKKIQQLDYCASVLLFLKINRAGVLPATMVYFSESEILFSRVSDFGAFSDTMVPAGKTLLCFEFPCTVGDALWNRTAKELAEHASEVLGDKRLVSPSEIEGSFVEYVSHSYPRFRKGFSENRSAALNFLAGFRNVISYGRQGGFSYVNTDAVTDMGFNAADAVIMAEAMGFSLVEWFNAHQKGE